MDPHHGLEAVEATNFSSLSFVAEPLDEVLVDDSVRRREKSEDMGDEVSLVIVQLVFISPRPRTKCRI